MTSLLVKIGEQGDKNQLWWPEMEKGREHSWEI